MSTPVRYIHNLTESDRYYGGVLFPASTATQIPYQIYQKLANSDVIYEDLAAGLIDISPDGTNTYSTLSLKIDALKGGIPQAVTVEGMNTSQQPFAAKILPNGKKIFRRAQGISATLTSSTTAIEYVVPYTECKITGLTILNGKIGDTANFKVLDTAAGTVTTVPYYLLNQFGYNINVLPDVAAYPSVYDADLFAGLVLRVEYTSVVEDPERVIYLNFDLHEVKD